MFLPVLGEGLDHEGIDGVDDVLDGLLLHAGALDVLRRRRGVLFLLRLLLVLGLLVASLKLFVDRSSQHHEERKEYVEVIRFCQSFVDFSQEFAEDIGAGFIVKLFRLIVFGFLLLWVEIDINFVKIALHVYLLEGAIIVPLLSVGHEIAKSIDAIGGNIFGVAITIVHFFLY